MKAKKAIQILQFRLNETESYTEIDERDAVKLGIEALKRILNTRKNGYSVTATKLPGETPENE